MNLVQEIVIICYYHCFFKKLDLMILFIYRKEKDTRWRETED